VVIRSAPQNLDFVNRQGVCQLLKNPLNINNLATPGRV